MGSGRTLRNLRTDHPANEFAAAMERPASALGSADIKNLRARVTATAINRSPPGWAGNPAHIHRSKYALSRWLPQPVASSLSYRTGVIRGFHQPSLNSERTLQDDKSAGGNASGASVCDWKSISQCDRLARRMQN